MKIKNNHKKNFNIAIIGETGEEKSSIGTGYGSYETVLYNLNKTITDINNKYEENEFLIKHIIISYYKKNKTVIS